jgi:hypothetical protein
MPWRLLSIVAHRATMGPSGAENQRRREGKAVGDTDPRLAEKVSDGQDSAAGNGERGPGEPEPFPARKRSLFLLAFSAALTRHLTAVTPP